MRGREGAQNSRSGILTRALFYNLAISKLAGIIVQMAFFISSVLPIIQVILSVLLMAAILLQRSEAGLGSAFGADGFSAGFHERRGLEKTLFYSTIILGILFALSALITLFFH